MRKSILLLLPVAVACSDTAADPAAVIDDFRETAVALTCEPVELGLDAAATEIRLASDSTWTLLDASQLQVLTLTDEFDLVDHTPLTDAGPAAAGNPVSAVLLGDSAVAVAARGGLRLVVLTLDGELLEATPLDFIPHSLEAPTSGGMLLTPMPLGPRPPTLLMRHAGTGLEDLPVPKRSYVDMTVNALGNSTLVESFPDGRALVMHQFLRPRAFIVHPDGAVEPAHAPTPDATRDNIDFIPRSPITEEQTAQILAPAMAMTIDPRRSDVYILTRSGGELGGRLERAVLRLSDTLDFLEGYTLPVVAVSMVYLPRRHAALVVDDADGFHLCPLPEENPDDSAL